MKNQNLKIGFVTDSIQTFNPKAETTSFLAFEAIKRKAVCFFIELKNLWAYNSTVCARAFKVSLKYQNKKFDYQIKSEEILDLADLDVLFLRKDPPVDLNFITHLHLLSILEKNPNSPLMVNSPSGILNANEKLYPFLFKNISPQTVTTSNVAVINDFVNDVKTAVIKPLNLSGGSGIFILKASDANKNSIIETATFKGTSYVQIQKYLPQIKKGDKRIMLFKDQILGCFLRVPSKKDFRGNLHSGAVFRKSSISKVEQKIINQIKPQLIKDGLLFVGLDFIGEKITEINTTSPMGISEINSLYQLKVEEMIFDSLNI